MMIFCLLVAIVGLIFQYHQFQMITNFSDNSTGINLPIFLLIGTMTVAGGAVGFGRPLAPFVISFAGVIASVFVYKNAPGLMDWFEKTMLLIALLCTFLEYGYYACCYDEETE